MDLKKLKIFLLIFLISIIFIPKVNASINTNNGKFPNIPTDATSYMISYTGSVNSFYLSYCKGDNEVIIPTREALSTGPYPIGYCYNKNTKSNQGYAYRRDFVATGINVSDILTKNVTDFSSFTWGTEQRGSNYTSTSLYKYNSLSRLVILDDYSNYNMANNLSYVFYTNENIYNNWGNGTTLTDNLIILNKDLFSTSLPIDVSCNLQPLGVVKNVSSFTYEVSGIGNALDLPLKGQFAFVGRGGTPLLTNDYNIQVKEKNNEDIEGRYEFQCNDEDIGNGCMLKYEYNYIDDIDTSLILQFTFTSMTGQLDYEYSFYSCNVNNSKMNYTYIDNIGGNNQIVENPSLENSINDDNITESDNFLNDNIINNSAFNQDHGLTAIIQAPINFLQSLSSKTCSNIVLPIPHLGNATIPCMSSIYSSKFNELYNILKIIINGVLCYRMALSVVMIVKGAKDPDNDKIEVMDL